MLQNLPQHAYKASLGEDMSLPERQLIAKIHARLISEPDMQSDSYLRPG